MVGVFGLDIDGESVKARGVEGGIVGEDGVFGPRGVARESDNLKSGAREVLLSDLGADT